MGFESVIGSVGSILAGKEKGKAQKRALQSIAEQKAKFEEFRKAGLQGLDRFNQSLTPGSDFTVEDTPAARFRRDQLNKELATRLTAAGKGRSIESIANVFAPQLQSLSFNEAERQAQQNFALANLGLTATQSQSALQPLQSQAFTGIGDARAGQAVGVANSLLSGIRSAASFAGAQSGQGFLQDLVNKSGASPGIAPGGI